ncbi:unnamed protein product [Spirodela intermedia]|uniref:Uncharacterized protein n=1 Tax=Spirodela intermedia TaxID=51605 RepID=A0A7I8IND2_SPIIN|nr:unnamed protein product [Spirodela intermedia]CAA6658476.1 unnamed protein product [Spirodela intermedia]
MSELPGESVAAEEEVCHSGALRPRQPRSAPATSSPPPSPAPGAPAEGSGKGFSKSPMESFTRRILLTASSILLIGMNPPSPKRRGADHVDTGEDASLERESPVLKEVGDEEAIGVHLDPVPAGEGDHHRGDSPGDGVVVGRHVDAEQAVEVDDCVVLVDALLRPAVADVLGNGSLPVREYSPGNSKADIMGEDGGLVDVVVAVDCVDPVEHGDSQAGGEGGLLDLPHHLDPVLR